MEKCTILELEEVHAKELSVIAHDVFKVTYEHKLLGKFEQQNFKNYLKKAFAHAQMMKEIQDPNSRYFGVFENQKMIAYQKLNFLENQTMERPDDHIEIERLYIIPAYQGMGLGRYMINWISRWALENKYSKLWLRSWERNEEAIAFYKKMGLEIIGTAEYKFEESDDVDFVIEKDLV